MNIKQNLIDRIIASKLPHKVISDGCGLSYTSIYRLMNSDANPTIGLIDKVNEYLDQHMVEQKKAKK